MVYMVEIVLLGDLVLLGIIFGVGGPQGIWLSEIPALFISREPNSQRACSKPKYIPHVDEWFFLGVFRGSLIFKDFGQTFGENCVERVGLSIRMKIC